MESNNPSEPEQASGAAADAAKQRAEVAKRLLDAYVEGHDIPLTLDPKPVNPGEVHKLVRPSWNYLTAAKEIVENMLTAAARQRALQRAYEGKQLSGQLRQSDQDLLRAALVFAGAGLDSTLKQLLKDCLSEMTRWSDDADEKLKRYAADHIKDEIEHNEPSMLVDALLSDRPRDVLEANHINSLIGGSLQSNQQVQAAAAALGVKNVKFFKRTNPDQNNTLKKMFQARNTIVHELDIRERDMAARGVLSHLRITRTVNDTRVWAAEALSVAQFVVNDVNARLKKQMQGERQLTAESPAKSTTQEPEQLKLVSLPDS